MTPLVKPIVNLNGATRESLVHQQLDVKYALDAALKAMSDAFPHGRDFQLNPLEYPAARAAWEERMNAVAVMANEIESHALAILIGDK